MQTDLKLLGAIRKQLGLTQTEFAKQAGVSQSLIAKIEAEAIDPTYSRVQQIFAAIERLSNTPQLCAKDVMNTHVVTVDPGMLVFQIAKLMNTKSISQIPVLEHRQIIGMITEREIVESIACENFKTLRAKDIMTDTPPIVSEETLLSVLHALMVQYPMAIVAKKGAIVGIVTKSDLIKHAL
ncbi:CBS domain-containing protein [Candidatus Woesearchaeota archaeon]|nr:CBS domain-containing protein [Candidatus Woesearchaeota archaeon]